MAATEPQAQAPAPAEPAPPPPADFAARLAAAAAALDAEPESPVVPPAEAEAAPEGSTAAASPEAEPAAEPASDTEPEPDTKPDGKQTPAWRHAELRRKEKALERREAELRDAAAKLEAQRVALEPYQRTLAEIANREAAEAAKAQPGQVDSVAMQRIQQLEQRLQQMQQSSQSDQMRAAYNADLAAIVQAVGTVEQHPELAVWDAEDLHVEAAVRLSKIYRERTFADQSADDIANELRAAAQKRYERLTKALAPAPSGGSRDGQGLPAAKAAKPAGQQGRVISNRETAIPAAPRALSRDERLDRAGALLQEALK